MMIHWSRIYPRNKTAMEQVNQLLVQEGIQRDNCLDFTLGFYDGERLVATGSSYKNTLRCLAVDRDYQGQSLMNSLITELLNHQRDLGYDNTFVYTKLENGKFFQDLGFYPIAETDRLLFLETRKNAFPRYLDGLLQNTKVQEANSSVGQRETGGERKIAAIVMNANPFTLGHLFLAEKASRENDQLHLFMVSEESSLIPFDIRQRLIREGTAHLDNIFYHSTESYMVSQATFPSYFIQDENEVILAQARLDLQLFVRIAKHLGISSRYVGTEPYSRVTSLYNTVMMSELPKEGISLHSVERLKQGEMFISASQIRQWIKNGEIKKIEEAVPPSTFRYFSSDEAKPVIQRIQSSEDVLHY